MNPTRRSTWDDPAFRSIASPWGSFYSVTRELIENVARVLVTPMPGYLRAGDRWVRALRDAFAGRKEVAEALGQAAADIDRIAAAGGI